jgi:hypothetical protein
MRPKRSRSFAWILVAVAAIIAAFLAGVRQGQVSAMGMLQAGAAGNLTQRIEALSHLRMGETSEAIRGLEEEADQLTLSIAANEGADKAVLLGAKAYRTIVPPPASRSRELEAVFGILPEPKPSHCGAALQRLLSNAHRTSPGS